MASARPRLWVTARLQVSAPGQATTSRDSSAPGSAMPMADEPLVEQRAAGASDRPRKTRFWRLVMRTSAPSSRWIEASARNCAGGDVAEAGVGDGRDGALGDAAHDVGVVPGLVRVVAAERRPACPGRSGWACRGRGRRARRRASATVSGMPPGQVERGDEELALLEDAGLQLVPAHRVDEPLHAGPQLVVAVAVVREDPEDRLDAWRAGPRGA